LFTVGNTTHYFYLGFISFTIIQLCVTHAHTHTDIVIILKDAWERFFIVIYHVYYYLASIFKLSIRKFSHDFYP